MFLSGFMVAKKFNTRLGLVTKEVTGAEVQENKGYMYREYIEEIFFSLYWYTHPYLYPTVCIGVFGYQYVL